MFAIAHAYLMEQLFAQPQPMNYLGCVWPDMLFNGPLLHKQTHKEGAQFLAFILQNAPDLIPFALAVITHGSEPHGFDWFSDEAYDPGAEKGYAFERIRPFVDEVIAVTHAPPEMGLWKGHNFVEMTFEAQLSLQYPHLGVAVANACHAPELVSRVAEIAAAYFHQPAKALAENITRFPDTVSLQQPTYASLAEKYATQLELKHGITDADIPGMTALLQKVSDAIAADRDIFLQTSISEVGKTIASYL